MKKNNPNTHYVCEGEVYPQVVHWQSLTGEHEVLLRCESGIEAIKSCERIAEARVNRDYIQTITVMGEGVQLNLN